MQNPRHSEVRGFINVGSTGCDVCMRPGADESGGRGRIGEPAVRPGQLVLERSAARQPVRGSVVDAIIDRGPDRAGRERERSLRLVRAGDGRRQGGERDLVGRTTDPVDVARPLIVIRGLEAKISPIIDPVAVAINVFGEDDRLIGLSGRENSFLYEFGPAFEML